MKNLQWKSISDDTAAPAEEEGEEDGDRGEGSLPGHWGGGQ